MAGMTGTERQGRRLAEARPCAWAACAGLAAAASVFLLALVANTPAFYINDDAAIQGILSGATALEPTAYTIYSNYYFCLPLAWLYRVVPGHPWWYHTIRALQLACLWLWNYLTIRVLQRRLGQMGPKPEALVLGVALATGMCWAYLPLARPTFTFCSASLGALGAAAFGVVEFSDWMARRERVTLSVLGAGYLVLGCLVRFKGGVVGLVLALCVAAARVLWLVAEGRAQGARVGARRVGLVLAVPFVALALALAGRAANSARYATPEWVAFRQVDSARSAYMDAPHDSYDDNPQLYESVGWDRPLEQAVSRWFFLDRRVTKEAFAALSKGSSAESTAPLAVLAKNFRACSGVFSDSLFVALMAVVMAETGALALFCDVHGKDAPLSVIALLAEAYCLCATGFLIVQGRLIYRAAFCAVLPSVSFVWFVLLMQGSDVRAAHRAATHHTVAVGAATCLVGCAVALAAVTKAASDLVALVACVPFVGALVAQRHPQPGRTARARLWSVLLMLVCVAVVGESCQVIVQEDEARLKSGRATEILTAYALDHPSDLFVYPSGLASTDPYRSYAPNVTSWGGWPYFCPWKKDVFARMGYPGGLWGESLLDDNAYLFTRRKADAEALEEYLESIAGTEVTRTKVLEFDDEYKLYTFEVDEAGA